jgi:hypothetical protein
MIYQAVPLVVEVAMAIRISQTNSRVTFDYSDGNRERSLTAQEAERLAGVAQGDAIISTCGVVWVTQEGDPDDYMLRKGERFVAHRHGTVVVQALDDGASFRISKN